MDTVPLSNSAGRIVAGFLIAPLVASAALPFGAHAAEWLANVLSVSRMLALDDMRRVGWIMPFVVSSVGVAYPSTLFLGLPTFFVLRRKVALSPLNCILAGVWVASAPWIGWVLLRNPYYWSDGPGRIYHMNGHYTALGWIEVGKGVLYYFAFLGPLGALGGLAFWLIAAAGA